MKELRKPEYPEKPPDDELQKMPHTNAGKFKPQLRLEPALWHWAQARKADVLTITPRVAVVCQYLDLRKCSFRRCPVSVTVHSIVFHFSHRLVT